MRVLEAFGEPVSYGGQESFVMNVLENMDMTGIEADLMSPYYCDNSSIADRVKELGGRVYALGCSFRPGKLRGNAAKPVRQFLREHHYDVIHIHSGSNSMLAMLARLAHEAGIPSVIVHSHCTGRKGWKHLAAKTATAHTLKKYPTAYCACSREAGVWRFPAGICRDKLTVINNGIDVDKFRYDETARKEMRDKLDISDSTVLVGCVGRLTYQKNQSFLLDVMSEVRRRCEQGAADIPETSSGTGCPEYRLILIGDGEDHEALTEKAVRLGISDDIIFTGSVENVQDYLQAIDVAVMPSRYEGLAIAVIEAQAAGLEIIASDKIPESAAVTGGVSFLPSDSKDEWVNAVMKYHGRHPEQADMVAAGGYSIRETAGIVKTLYGR